MSVLASRSLLEMSRKTNQGDACPIARTTDLMGGSLAPVLMREAFLGRRRFDAFYEALSMSRGVRANRLTRLVEAGLLTKRLYQERPRATSMR